MGPYLTVPKKEKDSADGEFAHMKYGACGMQGWRNTMEDSHITHFNLIPDVHFFGVFDGHGGKKCNIDMFRL
jgi:serine/threonine protein phosphatase PrpC